MVSASHFGSNVVENNRYKQILLIII